LDVGSISTFINDDSYIDDCEALLRRIENRPIKLVKNDYLESLGAQFNQNFKLLTSSSTDEHTK